MKNTLLICKCGDCDDWAIGKNKAGSFILCMTCGTRYKATIAVDAHDNLAYEAEKPALERGKKLVPKGKKRTRSSK